MHINGVEVCDPRVGRFFLVRSTYNNQGGRKAYHLLEQPGRTNQSHEERLSGWLGETDNISRTAEGAVEIYEDTAGKLRAKRIDAEALLAEDNVDIEEE